MSRELAYYLLGFLMSSVCWFFILVTYLGDPCIP
jgi:hypothetical protein